MSIVHDVPFNLSCNPSTPCELDLEVYIILKQLVYYDHRHPPSSQELHAERKRALEPTTLKHLQRRALLHDGPAMLELGLRRLAQLDRPPLVPEDPTQDWDNLYCLTGIMTNDDGRQPPYIYNHTLLVRLCALTSLSWIFFKCYYVSKAQVSLYTLRRDELLRKAANYAALAADFDFLPPFSLYLAGWFKSLQALHGIDIRGLEVYKEYAAWWEAYDAYAARRHSEEQSRLAKVAKAPNRYRCAADECPVQVLNGRALRKCGGPCPSNSKPHYCSAECQSQHWFVHRYFCKAGTTDVSIPNWDGDSDWQDIETYDPRWRRRPTEIEAWAEVKGAEVFVDIPCTSRHRKNEVFRVRTMTMSPAFLRLYKEIWDLPRHLRKKVEPALLSWTSQ
ncbi:hypothetical protein C8T65DRAFT_734619 [Cerioporus squamosus]|nr:hypothetical protein C8T65DRAFT_734619 [Cerioporus squamosus]